MKTLHDSGAPVIAVAYVKRCFWITWGGKHYSVEHHTDDGRVEVKVKKRGRWSVDVPEDVCTVLADLARTAPIEGNTKADIAERIMAS